MIVINEYHFTDEEHAAAERLFRIIMAKVDQILANQGAVAAQENTIMMATLQELSTEVTRETSIDQSVLALIQGLIAQVEANKTDPAALDGLLTQMKANADSLAAAVTANTPQAPAPTA